MPYYSDEVIAQMREEVGRLQKKSVRLIQQLMAREFRMQVAEEYAAHGVGRRVSTIARCVVKVFELLPPEQETRPDGDDAKDATIFLQAHVANCYGCLDNLVRIWIAECDLRTDSGTEFLPQQISFANPVIRRSFSLDFQQYIDGDLSEWFRSYLKEFRDSLGHRIPLYIAPYSVLEGDVDRYRELEQRQQDALFAGELDRFEDLAVQTRELERFHPFMLHSFSEQSGHVVFHPQMIADFNTIEKLLNLFLDELDELNRVGGGR